MVRGPSLVTAALAAAALGVIAPAPARAEAPQPWLGITFDGNSGLGARVIEVHPGTAAAAGGLQPGDEITAIGDVYILPGQELLPIIRSHRIGARLPITFVRGRRSFRVAPRLTARPSADEIVYQRLIDHALPRLALVDRRDTPVGAAELRRPMVWLVFDASCDSCGGAAAQLAAHLDERLDPPGGSLLRVVVIGSREQVEAYLARVPVLGTVWRVDEDDDEPGLGPPVLGGARLLSGLPDRTRDGTVLVVDHAGQVTFATTMSAGEAVHDGACAAASRALVGWRRGR